MLFSFPIESCQRSQSFFYPRLKKVLSKLQTNWTFRTGNEGMEQPKFKHLFFIFIKLTKHFHRPTHNIIYALEQDIKRKCRARPYWKVKLGIVSITLIINIIFPKNVAKKEAYKGE